MMINGTNGVRATNDINLTGGTLTPDMMMLYCSTRLGSIDDQVKQHFQKQQQYRSAAAAVNKLTSQYQEQAAQNGLSTSSPDHAKKFAAIEAAWNEAEAALPPGSKEKSELHELRMTWGRTMSSQLGGDGAINKEEATNIADSLGSLGKDLNGSAELDMMQLQSLMSQRQTAVQMCTNLVSSLNDTTKAIAQKIGA